MAPVSAPRTLASFTRRKAVYRWPKYRVYLLSPHRAWEHYGIGDLHLPRRSVTAGVLRKRYKKPCSGVSLCRGGVRTAPCGKGLVAHCYLIFHCFIIYFGCPRGEFYVPTLRNTLCLHRSCEQEYSARSHDLWRRNRVFRNVGTKFRSRGITQKKEYNIGSTAKIWNQE